MRGKYMDSFSGYGLLPPFFLPPPAPAPFPPPNKETHFLALINMTYQS